MRRISQIKKYTGVMHFKRAEKNYSEKNWLEAKRYYEKSLEVGFRTQQSRLKLAILLFDAEVYAEAKKHLEIYLEKSEEIKPAILLAKSYLNLQEYNNTIELIKSRKLDRDEWISVLDLLAKAYSRQNMLPEYIEVIERIFSTQRTAHRYNQLCFAYGRIGAFIKLKHTLKEALKTDNFNIVDKQRFIKATFTGLSRSFYYQEAVQLHEILDLRLYSDELLVDAAMLYEVNNKVLAQEMYQNIIEAHGHFDWWATYRLARLHYGEKRYKKSFDLLKKLFTSSGASIKTETLPTIISSLAMTFSNPGTNYKYASEQILKSLPGWDIRIWENDDSKIFSEYFTSIHNLMNSTYRRDDIEIYFASSYELGQRLSDKRNWKPASDHLHLMLEGYEKLNMTPPETAYKTLARALINQNLQEDARSISDLGLRYYPSSLDLLSEKAVSYQRDRNIYEAKKLWDYILENLDNSSFSPWHFTSAAEINFLSMDLETHESILRSATELYTEHQPFIANYVYNALCRKLINLTIEQTITGGDKFSRLYSIYNLKKEIKRYAVIVNKYTYNEESRHRIRHAYTQAQSLLLSKEWHKHHNVNTLIDSLFDYLNIVGVDALIVSVKNLIKKSRSSDLSDEIALLEETLLKTSYTALSSNDWLILYQILISNKFLYLGYLAREKSIEKAAKISPYGYMTSYYSLKQKFHAQLERKELKEAHVTLDIINYHFPHEPDSPDLQYLLGYSNVNTLQRNESKSDKIYRSKIESKSVAIVGPAPITSKLGNEIDSHDTVIRFNYRGEPNLDEAAFIGSRTDAVYQNGPNVRMYLRDNIPAYMRDVSIYNVEHIISKPLLDEVNMAKARKNNARTRLFNGITMAVPAVLHDIIKYNPKKISLYGSNFYLSENPYSKSYTNHNGESKYTKQDVNRLQEIIGGHDLIAQRRYVNRLVAANLVKPDEECAAVLGLSDEEYMSQLECLYSY